MFVTWSSIHLGNNEINEALLVYSTNDFVVCNWNQLANAYVHSMFILWGSFSSFTALLVHYRNPYMLLVQCRTTCFESFTLRAYTARRLSKCTIVMLLYHVRCGFFAIHQASMYVGLLYHILDHLPSTVPMYTSNGSWG